MPKRGAKLDRERPLSKKLSRHSSGDWFDVDGKICERRTMKNASLGYLLCAALFVSVAAPACGGSQKDAKSAAAAERVEGIDDTIALFKKKDSTIAELFSSSTGYVVIPSVGKGALIVGGAHGDGEAFEGGAYIGQVSVSEVSLGAQVGGQSYSQVVFFETPEALRKLKDNSFQFAAEVSAIGVDQGVAKNAKFKDGVATFVIPKQGLMASAAVGGQKLSFTPAGAKK